MMKTMGEQAVAVLGPAFEKLIVVIEALLPKLASGAGFAAEILAKVSEWVAGIVEAVAYGITAIQGLAQQGKLGELLELVITAGMLRAANMFINSLAVGVQMVVDTLLMPFKMITDGRMWSALGNTLLAVANLFIARMSSIGGVLTIAAAGMLQYILAGIQYAKDTLNPTKDADWNASLTEASNNSVVTATREVGQGMVESSAEDVVDAMRRAGQAMGQVWDFTKDNSPMAKLLQGKYKTPDLLGSSIEDSNAKLKNLLKEGFDAMPNPFDKKPSSDAEVPALKDVTGQGGPKAVVDSLQSVGGGGLSFGISWQDRMLEETKTQNVKLSTIADNTANASGIYGGGQTGGESPTVILSTISSTVSAILAAILSKNASTSGSTVSVRS
jgi:hypothetical protein